MKEFESSSKLLSLETYLKNQRGLLTFLHEEEDRLMKAKNACLSNILKTRRSILEIEKNKP